MMLTEDVRSVQLLDDLDVEGIYEVYQYLIQQMGEVVIDGMFKLKQIEYVKRKGLDSIK